MMKWMLSAFEVLDGREVNVKGLRVYGCAWDKYKNIPAGLDILVTHSPPAGIMDITYSGKSIGSPELRAAVDEVRPRIHIFGHNHDCFRE